MGESRQHFAAGVLIRLDVLQCAVIADDKRAFVASCRLGCAVKDRLSTSRAGAVDTSVGRKSRFVWDIGWRCKGGNELAIGVKDSGILADELTLGIKAPLLTFADDREV